MNLPPGTSETPAVRAYEPPAAPTRAGLRLLLTKFDRIGDFVSGLEAFRTMRNAFGGAHITLICPPEVVPLAQSTGFFDRVVGFVAKLDGLALDSTPLTEINNQVNEFMQLLDGKYFLAADFHHDMSTRHWLDYVDADFRAGFACKIRSGLDIVIPTMEWRVPMALIFGRNQPIHAETRLTLLAHAISESLFDATLDADMFKLDDDLFESPAYRLLKTSDLTKIGIGTGAGSPLRQWPVEHWQDLLNRLNADGQCLFVFTGGAVDRAFQKSLIESLPEDKCLDLTGDLPLSHVPAYLNALDAYIGCDTGLTHLAGKLGVQTLNLFAGVSNLAVWRARGPHVRTLYAEVSCAPCYKKTRAECPYENLCMAALLPAEVEKHFREILQR